jgi:hypothetical protein
MHARLRLTSGQRRGVVLVLILAMLGLLALIGVTFATLGGQAKVNANNYAQSKTFPQAEVVFDFGLDQIINDTNNPASAIRGHSLKRDMYGNDSTAWGYSQEIGCVLTAVPFVGAPSLNFAPLQFQGVSAYAGPNTALAGLPQYRINVPIGAAGNGATYGLNFRRWILRLAATSVAVAQTFEVLEDDDTGALPISTDAISGYKMHLLTLSSTLAGLNVPATTTPNAPAIDVTTTLKNVATGTTVPLVVPPPVSGTLVNQSSGPFTLDGRFLRAFNGPGLSNFPYPSAANPNPVIPTAAAYGNFLFNGIGNPNALGPGSLGNPNYVGMDEDYDAADLENWFMALQSADGSVFIPSFHRPGILGYEVNKTTGAIVYDDWTNTGATTALSRSKILRRRQIDMGQGYPADPRPDKKTGHIAYDVDNDGDGTTDAVWLDLGYPVQTDSSGKTFKPLFAFTILGLNGRLPLNTAGNIQGRQQSTLTQAWATNAAITSPYPIPYSAGDPTFYHTSHLGSSVSEINPAYYFMTATDPLGAIPLQQILTGNRNAATGEAVAGRWGEPEQIPQASALLYGAGVLTNTVRAGRSYPAVDGRDADYDTLDFYPSTNPPTTATFVNPTTFPEQSDSFDIAGAMQLPSERRRRFGTPDDPVGTGRPVAYNFSGAATSLNSVTALPGTFDYPFFLSPPQLLTTPNDFGTGPDNLGRVGFFMYFRPPGMPTGTIYASGSGTGPTIPDITTNLLRGFEANRNPLGTLYYPADTTQKVVDSLPYWMAAMPWNNQVVPPASPPTTIYPQATPTFTPSINSSAPIALQRNTGTTQSLPATPVANYGLYPSSPNLPAAFGQYIQGTLLMDEADQMNVYQPTPYDAPFGPSDLEWLYRKHDVDGTSLGSRLSTLVPQFFNTSNVTASRMFTTESWDRNNFVWAADNPGGVFPNNSTFTGVAAVTSPGFYGLSSASFDNKSNLASLAAGTNVVVPTPSVLHRDKKINLNYPLPIQSTASGGAFEPVRQKWITETYFALKQILPPKAVDRPEELAALSQFVINIVDFRDTDGIITAWTNPDIYETPGTAGAAGSPPTYFFKPASGTIPVGSNAVVQFGMEYQPLVINEVLAMNFLGFVGGKNMSVPRMFIELLNTLTRDGGPPFTVGSPAGVTAWAEDLQLVDPAIPPATGPPSAVQPGMTQGWQFAIAPDDPTGRPDPVTGQYNFLQTSAWTIDMVTGATAMPAPGNTNIPAMGIGGPSTASYYVFSNAALPGTEANLPSVENTNIPMSTFPGPATGATPPPAMALGSYYWLYLRRPADPYAAASTFGTAANPYVVVDSFRFPYTDVSVGVTGMAGTVSGSPSTNAPYSMQRQQPYRGGHNVPPVPAGKQYFPVDAYGYSEQTVPPPKPTGWPAYPPPATSYFGYYGTASPPVPAGASTDQILNTLGAKNSPSDPNWEYVAFYDRDFTSVAELALVPGCPPGLFTKKFLEVPPNYELFNPHTAFTTPPTPLTVPDGERTFGANTVLTYPYLHDEFYYTADGQSSYDNAVVPPAYSAIKTTPTPVIGWTTGAGWHKMFDFFEVPSNAFGAIGTVAQGQNFDWARDDRRPGQINLNLIIDEEVFLGLIDDPRLNSAPMVNGVPQVVTQVNSVGAPTVGGAGITDGAGTYTMSNRGYIGQFNLPVNAATAPFPMHQAFADFLKVRHGGSGFLFAWGSGAVNTPNAGNAAAVPPIAPDPRVAAERPFHSASFPDINFTIMRPASVSPSVYTQFVDVTQPGTANLGVIMSTVNATLGNGVMPPMISNAITAATPVGFGQAPSATMTNGSTTMALQPTPAPTPTTPWNVIMDPGLRNPYLSDPNDVLGPSPLFDLPPPVPARRLFQVPDIANYTYTGASGWLTAAAGRENAAELGDHRVNIPIWNANLALGSTDLFDPTVFAGPPLPPQPGVMPPFTWSSTTAGFHSTVPNTLYDYGGVAGAYNPPYFYSNLLGGFNYPFSAIVPPVTPPQAGLPIDNRRHPAFRTEMMSKMMNLSTVRTHQYAVWMTVGFFEVVRPGNPNMAGIDPTQVPDIIGAELGLNAGTNVRYRAFAIIDRSLATGFNPSDPGDFRDVIVYRRRIE